MRVSLIFVFKLSSQDTEHCWANDLKKRAWRIVSVIALELCESASDGNISPREEGCVTQFVSSVFWQNGC